MATRSELIEALTEKIADPAKKDFVDEIMDKLLDFLGSEDVKELVDALDDGNLALFETMLDRALTKRVQ